MASTLRSTLETSTEKNLFAWEGIYPSKEPDSPADSPQIHMHLLHKRNNIYAVDRLAGPICDNVARYAESRAAQDRLACEKNRLHRLLCRAFARFNQDQADHPDRRIHQFMLYFLQELNHYPKIFSSMELRAPDMSGFGCLADAIHLSLPRGKDQRLEIIYGLAASYEDERGAFIGYLDSLEEALRRAKAIAASPIPQYAFLNASILEQKFPKAEADYLCSVMIPSEDKPAYPPAAFALFIAYPMGIDPSSGEEAFDRKEAKKRELDMENIYRYLSAQIKALSLGAYPFYVYLLPMNDVKPDYTLVANQLKEGEF